MHPAGGGHRSRHAALLPEERRVATGDDGGNVSLLGPDGSRLWRCDLGDPVTGLAAADVNSDGRPELVASTSSGLLALYSRPSLSNDWRFPYSATPSQHSGGHIRLMETNRPSPLPTYCSFAEAPTSLRQDPTKSDG